MSVTDDLIERNAAFVEGFPGEAASPPELGVAIVTCMDSRVDPLAMLGLKVGEAHVFRNAGGIVTDDVLRTITISQRALGTREVLVIQHSKCGMGTSTDGEFRSALAADTGRLPAWEPGFFESVEESVRAGVARIKAEPFLVSPSVRGFVYDVETGALAEVE